ncbi:MAG: HigA family addiction module antidote protein [SAR324 cluster bacterium]|nr:HigA family addiction module antidote protein [SAR324 cluster bacterium]
MEKFNQMSHPGIIVKREFMEPYGVTAYRLSKDAKIDNMTASEIIRGKRSITIKTALKLAKYFGVSDSYFINLQKEYDMREVRKKIAKELDSIKTFQSA